MEKHEIKYLKINADSGLAGKAKGSIVGIKCAIVVEKIEVDGKEEEKTRYIPLEKYWRNRIKDSAIDNCVEFVDDPNQKEVAKTANEAEQEDGKPGGKDAKSKKSKK